MKLLRNCTLTLITLLILGGTAQAVFPNNFWRLTQIAERLGFIYGGPNGGVEHISLENDGRMRIGASDMDVHHGAILELKSDNKALLIPRVEVIASIATPENGMMVYENAGQCFKLYQAGVWTSCLGIASSIEVASQEPPNGMEGDAYYNTINNRLFVHDGQIFQEIKVDFETLTSSNHNCTVHELREPNLQIQCPANKQLVSLFYEGRTFTNTVDRHLIPEVGAVECCELTFGTYWWSTSDFTDCSGDTQTRTVSCMDNSGAVVSDSLCVGSQKPALSQSCGDSNPQGDQCFGGIDKDGNACVCGYANEITASTNVGEVEPAENILGFPDSISGNQDIATSGAAEFDNEGNTPGSVTIRLDNPVIDGPGNDLTLHLWDFNPVETFETLVSETGDTFVSLGVTNTAAGEAYALSRIGFDIANAGLNEVNFVKVVNQNVDMTTNTEGPDIDAFEARNCNVLDPISSCPVQSAENAQNGGFEEGFKDFYSEFTFQR